VLDIEAGDEFVHGTGTLRLAQYLHKPWCHSTAPYSSYGFVTEPRCLAAGRAVEGTMPWIFLLACMILRWELYRERARECEIVAQNADRPELRGGYLELAQKRRQLADEIKRLDPSAAAAAAADRLTARWC